MSGFKSFGDRNVTVNFPQGFTCIVGPNGNGKSNVIDALCFALGRLSKKSMRAKALTDLIFAGNKSKKAADKATVEVVFCNKQKEFPTESDEYMISRWIKQNGSSGYKVQGKGSTRQVILNSLAQGNVDPEGSNQFVLQGKIVELTHMSTLSRREFIESLIGLEKYDQMKDKTMKELEKADKDLTQFEAIFSEVSKQLKKVEGEKNDALKWKEYDNQIREYNSQLLALKIYQLKIKDEGVAGEIEELILIIEELDIKKISQNEKLNAEQLYLENIEEDLAVQEEDKKTLDDQITQQKTDLATESANLKANEEKSKDIESRITNLKEKQEELEDGKTYEDLCNQTEGEINGLKDETKSKDTTKNEIKAELSNLGKQRDSEKQNNSEIKSAISSSTAEIGMLKKQIAALNKKKTQMQKEFDRITGGKNVEEQITILEAREKELQKELQDKKTERKKLEDDRRRSEKKKDAFEAKRRSIEKDINQIEKRLSAIEVEVKQLNGEIKNKSKDLEENKAKNVNLEKDKKELSDTEAHLNNKIAGIQKKINNLEENRKALQADIKKKEAQQEESSAELQDVLKTLQISIQDVDRSAENVKATIQNASQVAIDESAKVFRDFVMDITDMLGTLEEIAGCTDDGEIAESLQFSVDTLKLLVENSEQPISQLNELVQDASDEAILESTEKFDGFIRDFVSEFDSIHVTLQALNLADSSEYYKQLDELSKSIQSENKEISKLNNQLTKTQTQLEQIEKTIKENNTKNTQLEKAVNDSNQKLEKLTVEKDEKAESIEELKVEIKEVEDQMGELKATDFFEQIKVLGDGIEEQTKEISQVKDNLNDLNNVQRLIEGIASSETEITEAEVQIGGKTKEIEEFQKRSDVSQEEIKKIELQVEETSKKIEVIEKEIKDLTKSINSLNITLEKQRQMDTRAKEIESLISEAEDVDTVIVTNEETIEQMEAAIGESVEKRRELIEEIQDLLKQRSESLNKQNEMRDEIGKISSELSQKNAEKNNKEHQKILYEEKIDELFAQSKEYGTLPPVTDDLSEKSLLASIEQNQGDKKKLEPVNLKSIEEYDVIKARWDEIDMRRQSLQRERKAIIDAIERIELRKTRDFMKAYHTMNREFSVIFQKLSPGGSAKMIIENPADPFEGGIEIEARPRGKKITNLKMLSGGEKTLVALSFIFAVQKFYPAPFYVMDEIDAALDGPNVFRVSNVIKEFADEAQFLVISHREENITNADQIYGVSMTDGITDVFTVDLEEEREREDYNTEDEVIE